MNPWIYILGGALAIVGLGYGAKGFAETSSGQAGAGDPPVSVPDSVPYYDDQGNYKPLTWSQWTRFDEAFKRYATSYGIPWTWLKTFALNETILATDPRTAKGQVSSDGLSYGLMQVTVTTAQSLDQNATPELLKNLSPADYSIDLAALYISQLIEIFGANPEYVSKGYNGGAGNVQAQIAGTLHLTKPTVEKRINAYWARWQRNYNLVQEYLT